MAAKYDLKKTDSGKFMFNLKAGNGEIILTSQLYTTKDAAENGIESCRTNSPNDDSYERLDAKNGDPYFNLKAGNGQVIGRSEMYSSASSRDNGIESVKKNGPEARVDDQTG